MRTTTHKQARPAVNPAELPYVTYDGACTLLGGCETYLRDLVAQGVLSAPLRLPGGRGRRLFHVPTLIRELDALRAQQVSS